MTGAGGPGGWRGGRVSRLEGLTDAVFGFSIALLIVSLEVPADLDGLLATMRGFAGFAFSFAILILVWFYHYRLFSRFKLDDTLTVLLNSVLLFVVLFYVYPLKFVFTLLTDMVSGGFSLTFDEVAVLMTIYSAGFVAVFLVFALMYHQAFRLRAELGLDAHEELAAVEHVSDCLIMVGVGALSIVVALTGTGTWAGPLAGFCYFLIAPAQMVNSRYFDRRRGRLPREGAAGAPGSNTLDKPEET